jgi:hypothetical protein
MSNYKHSQVSVGLVEHNTLNGLKFSRKGHKNIKLIGSHRNGGYRYEISIYRSFIVLSANAAAEAVNTE